MNIVKLGKWLRTLQLWVDSGDVWYLRALAVMTVFQLQSGFLSTQPGNAIYYNSKAAEVCLEVSNNAKGS